MHKITKTMRTETAHRLLLHKGLCHHLHGHSYKWEVTISSPQLNLEGMVMDFSILKTAMQSVIGQFDHATVLNEHDTVLVEALTTMRTVIFRHEPTAELMCRYVAGAIKLYLPTKLHTVSVRLWETETSYAEWCEHGQK